MRSEARIKLGYYPLPEAEGSRLRRLLNYPAGTASVLDPCTGAGLALNQLTKDVAVSRYGIELDADRARAAREAGIETIHGNAFDTQAKVESFSLLYLNPPYDSEIGSFENRRMEFLFLEHTYRWLRQGGVLIMVIQHRQVQSCVPLLAAHFTAFSLLRLQEPESVRFDQVTLLAVRRKIDGNAVERNRKALLEAIWRKPLPILSGNEPAYDVPPTKPTQLAYRGLPLDQLEDMAAASPAWKKIEPFLLPREEVAVGRPITPLHGGHVGLLCTAGLLNGVFGQGSDRHIARWRTVKHVTTFEVKEEGYMEIHKRERFSNEVTLVYVDGRTSVLTEKKKGDEDAECAPAARAA